MQIERELYNNVFYLEETCKEVRLNIFRTKSVYSIITRCVCQMD
jgi:hypothetical protein